MKHRSPFVALVAALVMLAASCGDDMSGSSPARASTTSDPPTSTPATSEPPTTEAPSEPVPTEPPEPTPTVVEVVSDIPYFATADGAVRHLDVHHPAGAVGLPLVVVFHTNPVFGGTKARAAPLATRIAEGGAVVVAPTYGGPVSMSDMSAVGDAVAAWSRQEGPCAVWAAVDVATEYGADPARVVLVGETTGTFPAQGALFAPPDVVAGCKAAAAHPNIERAVLFETGGFLLPDIWDGVLAADPDALSRMRPWSDLRDPSPTQVVVLAGEIEAVEASRSLDGVPYADSEWVRQRDPDLAFAGFFESHGALDDGTISSIDISEVMVDLMGEAGWNAEFAIVPGVGHALTTEESRALVADLALG